jgi:uncharacterized protein (DUF58 family)
MLFKYHAQWNKLQYGVHLAAALMHVMQKQRDAVGLYLFDEHLRDVLPPKTTLSHLRRMYAVLEQQLNTQDVIRKETRITQTTRVLHQIAESVAQRGLIIIISDLLENQAANEPLQKALNHLRHNKHEVLVLNLVEYRAERALEVNSERLLLKDLESSHQMTIEASQIKEDYIQRINNYLNQIRLFCDAQQITFEEIDTEAPFEKALLAYLLKRKKLG